MKHTFHAIITDAAGKHLFAAVSASVKKFNIETGALEATYTLPAPVEAPPKKKAKTTDEAKDTEERNKEKQQPAKANNAQEGVRAIRTLALSRNEKYLIGTESKSVYVLNASDLSLISARTFPKRPSSVTTSIDDSDLVVGDKFGDVYSVPLLATDALVLSSSEAAKEAQSASIQPILGHVSMLVDIQIAEADGKQYVITADRDEHIRVSKFPQAYIIDRWLFGHTEFVSELTLVPWKPELLLSGGGDDFLAVWNWTTGALLQKFEIRSLLATHLTEEYHTALRKGSDLEISISRIVALPKYKQVAVLAEATNVILILELDAESGSLKHLHTLQGAEGTRFIDLAASEDKLVASVDGAEASLVSIYEVTESGEYKLAENEASSSITKDGSLEKTDADQEYPLYGIKHLRKRGEF